jgi:hypothetical protein
VASDQCAQQVRPHSRCVAAEDVPRQQPCQCVRRRLRDRSRSAALGRLPRSHTHPGDPQAAGRGIVLPTISWASARWRRALCLVCSSETRQVVECGRTEVEHVGGQRRGRRHAERDPIDISAEQARGLRSAPWAGAHPNRAYRPISLSAVVPTAGRGTARPREINSKACDGARSRPQRAPRSLRSVCVLRVVAGRRRPLRARSGSRASPA